MDPIALVLAAYIDSVQSTVNARVSDTLGTEVKAVIIDYEGVPVPFQYQMWRVKDKTVCSRYQSDLTYYSHCTVTAKELFTELCSQLSQKPSEHWRYTKTKNMYCNAAVSYEVIIAWIDGAEEGAEDEEAKAACNLAGVAALGSRNPVVIAERDRVCGG
ncbi:MAG: hypothetical protein ACPIB1_09325 [Porticoccaceae bacterium]|jgi:hypothetical protein